MNCVVGHQIAFLKIAGGYIAGRSAAGMGDHSNLEVWVEYHADQRRELACITGPTPASGLDVFGIIGMWSDQRPDRELRFALAITCAGRVCACRPAVPPPS